MSIHQLDKEEEEENTSMSEQKKEPQPDPLLDKAVSAIKSKNGDTPEPYPGFIVEQAKHALTNYREQGKKFTLLSVQEIKDLEDQLKSPPAPHS